METPKRIALDTSIIIHHLRGKKESQLIAKLQDTSHLATTIINAFELYYGAYKSKNLETNLASAKTFLSSIEILDLDDHSAEKSAEVLAKLESTGIPIDPRDLFTACIALENGYAVLTLNQKHFNRVPSLMVLNPTDLK
ncbi:MAG: type II toxin-antitoxin system VapC family toxin [Thaumarchaeota archaeon]|nr:type II toxin-antitoxin system VapC family toxin [Nitrososphaerota archaeon]